MYLKKLEISGFKSFADKTAMDFLVNVTAIVGPNGSGKSNIADAIRWVLGEQSTRTLRIKKGEDIIFNGTPKRSRMNKATVSLILDNKNHYFPIDYEEVVISRKIFRDGQNEYFLNGSQVRLKDIHELLAKSGLGETKYNIISQGAADEILNASASERRRIFEEASGLKELEMKKSETERKLEATTDNLKQARALVSEIAPHLKYLERQAKKASEKGIIEDKLATLQKIYFSRSYKDLVENKNKVNVCRNPLMEEINTLEKEIEDLKSCIEMEEKPLSGVNNEYKDLEKLQNDLQSKRQRIEREIGRLEGRLEAEYQIKLAFEFRNIDISYIKDQLLEIHREFSLPLNFSDIGSIKERFNLISQKINDLIDNISKGRVSRPVSDEKEKSVIIAELENQLNKLKADLGSLLKESQGVSKKLASYNESFNQNREKLKILEKSLREMQDKLQIKKDDLRRWDFEIEKVKIKEEEICREAEENGIAIDGLANLIFGKEFKQFIEMPLGDLYRKMERLKIELEQVGAIDSDTLKEYNETKNRYDFLTTQIADLESASASLYNLLKTIEEKINTDFELGFAKINKEFNKYFKVIFGGGSAELVKFEVAKKKKLAQGEDIILSEAKNLSEDDEEMQDDESEAGIEIKVDLPRKKIRSLNMLSGGERALTSIALLFAIIAVNPPPFIVLDEIDAALDEANSKKYANILQELAEKTQFVIVTHNRESMHQAGALYGVTITDGISKIVSMKLD